MKKLFSVLFIVLSMNTLAEPRQIHTVQGSHKKCALELVLKKLRENNLAEDSPKKKVYGFNLELGLNRTYNVLLNQVLTNQQWKDLIRNKYDQDFIDNISEVSGSEILAFRGGDTNEEGQLNLSGKIYQGYISYKYKRIDAQTMNCSLATESTKRISGNFTQRDLVSYSKALGTHAFFLNGQKIYERNY